MLQVSEKHTIIDRLTSDKNQLENDLEALRQELTAMKQELEKTRLENRQLQQDNMTVNMRVRTTMDSFVLVLNLKR